MSFNLSELFELVADTVPDSEALVAQNRRLTFRELDERATRLAHALSAADIGVGDKVGLQLVNGCDYIEAMLAAFKIRAVPVNINYRYVGRELAYLYDHLDLKALIFHACFGEQVADAVQLVPALQQLIVVDDDSDTMVPSAAGRYEDLLAAAPSNRNFRGRTSDDVYIACTGGTTGLPKGVLWRHEDVFFATMGGGDPTTLLGPITDPEQLRERVLDPGAVGVITPPLMHVSAHWGAFQILFGGGKVVLPEPGSFNPAEVWRLIEQERAMVVTLVGDAMLRPLLDEYEAGHFEASSLLALASGGASVSASSRARIKQLLPHVAFVDGFGSTETGVAGQGVDPGGPGKGPVFRMDGTVTVLDDDLRPVEPGGGVTGRLARRGHIPFGYYKEPEKSRATFVEVDCVRWVLPGDLASVDADGDIILHGRGSTSINTGGEKVYPEEVEAVLIEHPAIADLAVVGVSDDRWGQRVVAVVQPAQGEHVVVDELRDFARQHLAGYKIPRDLVLVDHLVRNPTGKADYEWARQAAIDRLEVG